MLHRTVGTKYAAVAGTVEAVVALEVRDGTAQVGADRAGNCEALVAIAKDEDLFVHQEGGRAKGKVSGIANLERLRRLVKDARYEEADNGTKTNPYR
jgi:hypothetical protein